MKPHLSKGMTLKMFTIKKKIRKKEQEEEAEIVEQNSDSVVLGLCSLPDTIYMSEAPAQGHRL